MKNDPGRIEAEMIKKTMDEPMDSVAAIVRRDARLGLLTNEIDINGASNIDDIKSVLQGLENMYEDLEDGEALANIYYAYARIDNDDWTKGPYGSVVVKRPNGHDHILSYSEAISYFVDKPED